MPALAANSTHWGRGIRMRAVAGHSTGQEGSRDFPEIIPTLGPASALPAKARLNAMRQLEPGHTRDGLSPRQSPGRSSPTRL